MNAQPQKVLDKLVPYINKRGVWSVPAFYYQGLLNKAEIMIDRSQFVDGYSVRAFAYYVNGEMEKSRQAFEQLVTYTDDPQFIGFFILVTAYSGDFFSAIDLFDKHYGNLSIDNIDIGDFQLHISHLLGTFNKNRLQSYYEKYKNSKIALSLINQAIENLEKDMTIFEYASVNKDVVIKAFQLCLKTMWSKGNFEVATNFVAYEPNSDIIIEVHSYDFDEKVANELYEEWLDVAVDYDGDDFAEFSRVLFKFVPLKEKS